MIDSGSTRKNPEMFVVLVKDYQTILRQMEADCWICEHCQMPRRVLLEQAVMACRVYPVAVQQDVMLVSVFLSVLEAFEKTLQRDLQSDVVKQLLLILVDHPTGSCFSTQTVASSALQQGWIHHDKEQTQHPSTLACPDDLAHDPPSPIWRRSSWISFGQLHRVASRSKRRNNALPLIFNL